MLNHISFDVPVQAVMAGTQNYRTMRRSLPIRNRNFGLMLHSNCFIMLQKNQLPLKLVHFTQIKERALTVVLLVVVI